MLTDLTNAMIVGDPTVLYGKVLSRPALLVTDGKSTIWACDVDVGLTDPTGLIDQSEKYLGGIPQPSGDPYYTPPYQSGDDLVYGTILRNVPIARNNDSLLYADVGNPVILQRDGSGQWQIVGFGQEMTGTRVRIAVDLGTLTIGSITDLSIDSRVLTLAEIGIYGGGFGVCPLGAVGIFVGGVLKGIK
jgi:hypothetical protein